MGAWKRLFVALALVGVLALPVLADTRKGNIDVIIALDKSLSMENKIGAVKDWVNSYIIDQLLIPGDYLVVVSFYGKADVTISQSLKDDSGRAALKNLISQIKGNGRYTDIGNALDVLKAQIALHESDSREKYVLLLTDGIQEAPPGSKYYSKDGKFNHEFLVNTKTIQEKGWKVMVLGLGTDTAARDLATELQGSYKEVANNPTTSSLTEKAGSLFSEITVQGGVRVGPVSNTGSGSAHLRLKSSGLPTDAQITVNGATAHVGTREVTGLLPKPYTFTVKKDGPTDVSVPLQFPPDLPQGASSGTLSFAFSSAERFTPSDAPVTFMVQNWLQSNIYLIGGGILVLLIIAALVVVLVMRLGRGGPMQFAVLIEDEPVGEDPVALGSGREVFLNELSGAFSLASRRNAKSLARFSVKDGKLLLGVLKQDRFPKLKDAPPDARGKSFVLKSENGRNLSLKIQSRERKK
jgi:hypothetical protein